MVLDFYAPGASVLHHFDPRAKLVLLAALSACFLVPLRFAFQAAYLAIVLGFVAATLGIRTLRNLLAAMLPILAAIAILTPPFYPGGTVLLAIGALRLVSTNGLREMVRMLLRFSGVSSSFFLVFRTTDLDSFNLALRWYRVPFRATLVVSLVFRYIPTFAALYRNVVDAHKLRLASTAEPRSGTRKLERLIPVLTSVLIQAVKGIPALAMALESRGVGARTPRTTYVELKSGVPFAADMAVAIIVSGCLLAPLALR